MKTKSIGFIGGGRVTRIFLQAFVNKQMEFDHVVVFDTNAQVLDDLKKSFPFVHRGDLNEVGRQKTLFIALHPPVILAALKELAQMIDTEALVISLAPKITIQEITTILGPREIARMIPNATSYINQGYNPLTFGNGFSSSGRKEILELLNKLGTCFEVEEHKLEAYAILSAMLPTYFWFQWEVLSRLGPQMGLTKDESRASIQKTLIAAIHLMFDSGLTPEYVMDLIPAKPISGSEEQISEVYNAILPTLFLKLKPQS